MLVKELFLKMNISLLVIQAIKEEQNNYYWHDSYKFISSVWERDIEDLTIKQAKWVHQILDSCT